MTHSGSSEVAGEHAKEVGAETVLGIAPESLESPNLVITAIVLSVLLAVTISLRPASLVLAITGAFGLIFAALDILELLGQFQGHRLSIAAIATIAALSHLAITALVIVLLRKASASEQLAS